MLDFHLLKALHSAAGPATLDVRLHIAPGEFVALQGPSGAGKTTLLRLLAGLTRPDGGQLQAAGQTWYNATTRQWLPPQQRNIGYVFQDYALFPNMTVRQNLTFALPDRHETTSISDLLAMMDLAALADRYPAQLSGGQQQRVALARALASRPRLLLLDEPLAAVDQATRQRLQAALAQVHQQLGLTTILVSHEPAEIYRLASRVIELDLGRVGYDGPPRLPLQSVNTDNLHVTATVLEVLPTGQLRLRTNPDGAEMLLPVPAGHRYQPGEQLFIRPTGWELGSSSAS